MNMEKLCSINKKKKVAVIVLSHSPGHNSFNSWVSFSCLEKEIALREKKNKNVLKLLARLFFFMSVSLLLLTMNTPTLYFCLTKSRSIIFNNNNSNEN